jgi:tetratricopeptide (TPR) repeat protein
MYAEHRADFQKPVQKRRVALLVSMGKIQLAIGVLVDLLQISPTDAEAWAELSDLYLSQNSYDQAIFCLEEVLLVMPNAWNVSQLHLLLRNSH